MGSNASFLDKLYAIYGLRLSKSNNKARGDENRSESEESHSEDFLDCFSSPEQIFVFADMLSKYYDSKQSSEDIRTRFVCFV